MRGIVKIRHRLSPRARLARSIALPLLATGIASSTVSRAQTAPATPAPASLPNIVFLYTDDVGYGDLGAYGATDIPTPNVDALARSGLRFTDAHSEAATCTPSRYSILTGEDGFRAHAAILPGDAPALIRPGKPTIATMLKSRGYATAAIGKWHLGLGSGNVDWNKTVAPGPRDIGFDYSFILPSTPDRVPTVYLENRNVVGLTPDDPLSVSYQHRIGNRPTGEDHPELLRYPADPQHSGTIINHVSRIGYMKGGHSAEWVDEQFHRVLTDKASAFIESNQDRPFFLYFAIPETHVPRLPAKQFQGATKLGPRGDAIVEMDWVVGQVMTTLRRLHLDQNTLIVFSSDNGPVLNDGYDDGARRLIGDHHAAGPYRGGKYSAYEGGTRVPTITWWPGHIKPGVSNALVSQLDLFASIATLVHARLPANQAIDSQNVLPALLGQSATGRRYMFAESTAGQGLREGNYKFISAMKNTHAADFAIGKGIESGASTKPQLYDLASDPGERHNLATTRPAVVARMRAMLKAIRARKTFDHTTADLTP